MNFNNSGHEHSKNAFSDIDDVLPFNPLPTSTSITPLNSYQNQNQNAFSDQGTLPSYLSSCLHSMTNDNNMCQDWQLYASPPSSFHSLPFTPPACSFQLQATNTVSPIATQHSSYFGSTNNNNSNNNNSNNGNNKQQLEERRKDVENKNEDQTDCHPSIAPFAVNGVALTVADEQKQRDAGKDHRVDLARTIARLSLMVLKYCSASKQEIASMLMSCDVIQVLYKAMFQYPEQAELQQDIKKALTALQDWPNDNTNSGQATATATAQNSSSKRHSDSEQPAAPNSKAANEAIPTQKKRRKASKQYAQHRAELDVYQCTECGKQYKHLCNLQSHSKIHTDRAYQCTYCGKKFGRKANWLEHTRVHTGERPFECSVCHKAFKQKYALKEHVKKHCNH